MQQLAHHTKCTYKHMHVKNRTKYGFVFNGQQPLHRGEQSIYLQQRITLAEILSCLKQTFCSLEALKSFQNCTSMLFHEVILSLIFQEKFQVMKLTKIPWGLRK